MQWGVSKRAPHPSQVRKLILSRAAGDLLTFPLERERTLSLLWNVSQSSWREGDPTLPEWLQGGRHSLSLFSGQETNLPSDQERDSIFSFKDVLLHKHP